jgi:hypothetical protein
MGEEMTVSSANRVNPWVTHERLDGEVIAINLESGAYFAFANVAADCWSLLVAGLDTDRVAGVVAERYDVDPAVTVSDVRRFVGLLEAAGLITGEGGNGTTAADAALPAPLQPLAYTAPVAEGFDDLEDLLLLDPIHEVDEAGWPIAAAE